MIAFHRPVLPIVSLLCGLAGVAVVTHAQVTRGAIVQPMIFFVANGDPNACGSGCSQWIAAEGEIDPAAGLRLRDFLNTLQRRDLPIFLNSTGGSVNQAMLIARILREHRMLAGVGRTIPEACGRANGNGPACRRLTQTERQHRARLITAGVRCNSACVYALVGGSTRNVASDALLGIHSVRPLDVSPQAASFDVNDVHRQLKRHVIEMGVDPSLIDAAAKVSADRVRYVSRDEIDRFGIETRGPFETPWIIYEEPTKQIFVLKVVRRTNGTDNKDYWTGNVRLWCVGAGVGIWFVYRRELPSNEIGVATATRIVAGDQELALGPGTRTARGEASAITNWEFLQTATAVPSIVITEAYEPQGDVAGRSRVTKVSTDGLSKTLAQLHKDCGESSAAR
jgi:hypothetical protein